MAHGLVTKLVLGVVTIFCGAGVSAMAQKHGIADVSHVFLLYHDEADLNNANVDTIKDVAIKICGGTEQQSVLVSPLLVSMNAIHSPLTLFLMHLRFEHPICLDVLNSHKAFKNLGQEVFCENLLAPQACLQKHEVIDVFKRALTIYNCGGDNEKLSNVLKEHVENLENRPFNQDDFVSRGITKRHIVVQD